MLTVKASARPSKIEGIGLFADENIPKGEEMLVNYRAFDAHDENSKDAYLNK